MEEWLRRAEQSSLPIAENPQFSGFQRPAKIIKTRGSQLIFMPIFQ
jgi:hypothetical protein